MNKTTWIIVVVVVAVLGIFVFFNKSDNKNNMTDDSSAVTNDNGAVTNVTIKTSMGDVGLALFAEKAPITSANFIKLAGEHFYDGIKFHRVIDGFMIQAGDPNTKDDSKMELWGTGGPGYAIADEFGVGLSNVRGTIAMANSGPNTGGSQFFINVADNTFLDGLHPVFGKVTSGMDVVDAISKVQRDAQDRPLTPITITEIIVQ